MSEISIRKELQKNPVADEVGALIAITRPILMGLLLSLKREVADEVGGYKEVKLMMLPRLRRRGDGDVGICYEYAVHDAIRRGNPEVVSRIADAMKMLKVPGDKINSILFAAEKGGVVQLIDTARELVTDESRVMTVRGQPPKLKSHMNALSQAFRTQAQRGMLPESINGLWKADLFLGSTDKDRWVGTSVKINPAHLEGANGLRVGVVPAQYGRSDKIFMDDAKNLVVCPLPYDASFVELFYHAWHLVLQFINADALMPKDEFLPTPSHRQVVKELVARRDVSVLTVIEALEPLAQPYLLDTFESSVAVDATATVDAEDEAGVEKPVVPANGAGATEALIAPVSRELQDGAEKSAAHAEMPSSAASAAGSSPSLDQGKLF